MPHDLTTTTHHDASATQATLSRRAIFGVGVTAGLAAGLSSALLASGTALAEQKHDHHAAGAGDHSAHTSGAHPHQALVDAALHCVGKGDICTDHCIQLLAKGDTSLKDCIRSVAAMLPMCATFAKLAALDAPRLKQFAKVCRDICADCEKECKKHSDHHAACKACADSCAACIKECDKLGA